jgi:integrase
MSVHRLKAVDPTVKWKVKRAKPYGGKRQALTHDELDRLFTALKGNRHGHRDYMIALVTFLHGLRVSELIDLRWDDVDWRKGTIAIRRLKGSIDGTHYLERDEAIGLKRLQREQEPRRPHIFTSERGQAFSRFAINKMIATAGSKAKNHMANPSALPAAHHRHDAGQWRHGRLAIVETDGPRLDREHHQIRPDVPRTIERCVAWETVATKAAPQRQGHCAGVPRQQVITLTPTNPQRKPQQ